MALDRGKLERRTKEVDLATQKFIVGMKVLAPVMRNILPRTLSVRTSWKPFLVKKIKVLGSRCDSN